MNRIPREHRWLAAVSYLVWPISLLIVLSRLKADPFLRFHCHQALALGSSGLVLYLMLGLFLQLIPYMGRFLFNFLIVLWFCFKLLLALRCLQGEKFRIPLIYDLMWGVME